MELLNTILLRRYRDQLVRHVFVTRNYGRAGGWLRTEVWTHPSGDPTGITDSRIEYPPSRETT